MNLAAALLACLAVACTIMVPYVLKLWGSTFTLVQSGISTTLLGILFYLFSGVKPDNEGTLSRLRHIFVARVLEQPLTLFALCLLLVLILAATLFFGIYSETLCFEPDMIDKVEVSVQGSGGLKRLGATTNEKPLVRRVLAGTRQFSFVSEGYQPNNQELKVSPRWLSGQEHAVSVTMVPTREFHLLDFEAHAGDYFDLREDNFHIPKRLQSLPATTIAFSLAGQSKAPLRIQNVRLVVKSTESFQKSTFPADGLGDDGAPPLLGYAELAPEPGSYEVVVNKTQQGGISTPTDYRVLLLSPRGHRYQLQLQLRWVDTQNFSEQGEHIFEEEHTADFPEIVPWEKLVRGAQHVRLLFDGTFDFIGEELSAMQSPVSYSALIISSAQSSDEEAIDRLSNVHFVPEGTPSHLFDLVGRRYHSIRDCILIDDHTALLRDRERLDEGEIVREPERVREMVKAFDQLSSLMESEST